MATLNQKCMFSVYRGCQELGLAPVNQKMRNLCLTELPGAGPGYVAPKIHVFGLPELPGARPGSGEPKNAPFLFDGAARS